MSSSSLNTTAPRSQMRSGGTSSPKHGSYEEKRLTTTDRSPIAVTFGGSLGGVAEASSGAPPAHGFPSVVHVTPSAHRCSPAGHDASTVTTLVADALCPVLSITSKRMLYTPAPPIAQPSRPLSAKGRPHAVAKPVRVPSSGSEACTPRSHTTESGAPLTHFEYPLSGSTDTSLGPISSIVGRWFGTSVAEAVSAYCAPPAVQNPSLPHDPSGHRTSSLPGHLGVTAIHRCTSCA